MAEGLRGLVELIEHARRQGARGAEACMATSEGVAIEVQRGKAVRSDPFREAEVSLRVWDERGGEGWATSASVDGVAVLVSRALEVAARAEPDAFAGPVGRISAVPGGLGIDDRRHAALTVADRQEVPIAAEKGARLVDRRVRTERFRYVDRRTNRLFASSRGLNLEEWSTTYFCEGTVAVTDDSSEVTLSDEVTSRAFASIASLPYGANLAMRAVALLGPAADVRGPVRALLPPRAVAGLVEQLGSLFSVQEVEGEVNFMSRAAKEREGAPVFDTRVHLLDDGTVPGSLRTVAFDDRGVSPVPLTVLREGRLDGRYLDPTTARRRETRPTGHWHGGHLRPNNLILRGGSRSVNVLLTEAVAPVFLIDSMSGALDPKTGNWVGRAWGQMANKGQTHGALRNVSIRGNVLDVFNRIVEIASDTDRQGHVDAPAILVDGLVLD